MASVKEITSKQALDDLVKEHPYVVLQAHAAWSNPSKVIMPAFTTMAKQYAVPNTFAFARVDVDYDNDLELDIKCIPTFFFFENGAKTSSLLMPNRTSLANEVERFAKTANNASAVNGG